MTTDKKDVRPGSARARLEAFERQQQGKKGMFAKLGIVIGLILVLLVIQQVMASLEQDRGWFDVPKNTAYLAREGKWEDLRKHLADDVELQGAPGLTADAFIELLRSRGDAGIGAFATVPHTWKEADGQARVDFWVHYSRGDLEDGNVIPIVQTWLVSAVLVNEDEIWKAKKVAFREAISPSGAPSVEELIGR